MKTEAVTLVPKRDVKYHEDRSSSYDATGDVNYHEDRSSSHDAMGDVNYHDNGGHKLFCNANHYLPVEMGAYPKIPESSSTLLCGEFSSINILNR
jgi:hypothetical protein